MDVNFTKDKEIHGESNVWSTAQRQTKNNRFNVHVGFEDQLAMANSVRWCSHVLRREDGRVLRRALDFEVEGQMRKGRPNSV